MNGIWKKKFKRFVHDFKRFAKGEEVIKINKAVFEMAINFNLGVGEDDIELPEVLPEEVTNEELLELEQEHIDEDGARKRKPGEEREPPSKFTANGLTEALPTSASS